MKTPSIPLEKIAALEPAELRTTVPDSYRDLNGHMNVRWYVALFDDASDVLHDRLGLTAEYHRAHGSGTFDLEHHTHFLTEVMPGERVAIYTRYLGWSPKRLHYVMFLVNESRPRLAATIECINAYADLTARRTAEWPPEVKERIARMVERHAALGWPTPVSGVMAP
ncbi:MAG TPA: thioesterase family protein [Bryobacteraceae bacterium]